MNNNNYIPTPRQNIPMQPIQNIPRTTAPVQGRKLYLEESDNIDKLMKGFEKLKENSFIQSIKERQELAGDAFFEFYSKYKKQILWTLFISVIVFLVVYNLR